MKGRCQMVVLERIKQKIQQFLEELESPLVLDLSQKLQSGKMLRSKLILSITEENQEAILLCAIIEMIQNASLLHDDVIDEAPLRRSLPSINALFGNKNAIMLGDVLYSKAYKELLYFAPKYPMIPKIIADSVSVLAIGEMEDVAMAQSFNTQEKQYLAMITHKTAALIEASAYGAAFLAGKNEQDALRFQIYGRNLGIAFQIIDDVLDIVGNEETLGKPALSDFREGKTTLPYIYLYHSLDKKGQERLKEAFKRDLDSKEQEWLLTQIKSSKAIEKSIQLAKDFGQKGIEAIYNQSCDKLITIMSEMINRDF